MTSLTAIILAAGQGRRMDSAQPKVLHPIAGRAMLLHLLEAVAELDPKQKLLVVNAGARAPIATAVEQSNVRLIVQNEQLGSGHAVLQTQPHLTGDTPADERDSLDGDVLILYGDVPFVSAATMRAMVARFHAPDAPLAVLLAFEALDPTGYGRVLTGGTGGDAIIKLVEDKDATHQEKSCHLCNGGPMILKARDLFALLEQLDNDNVQGEYYLTDIVNIALAQGRGCVFVRASDWLDVAGVNSRTQLAAVEAAWQTRRRRQAMDEGATLIAPETVWFAWDTKIGRDVVIEPNIFFGPGVTIADRVTLRAHSHIVGATLATGVEVGPFARLREGTQLDERAKVGNFVEIKQTRLGKASKANHLTYLGDCDIGAGVNIGAGAISCNYDGYSKYRTEIADGAFIGSNVALVAPIKVGAGAIIAAGSVVTYNIGAGDLYLARGPAVVKTGWAVRFHRKMQE